jgi:hypothetical protein
MSILSNPLTLKRGDGVKANFQPLDMRHYRTPRMLPHGTWKTRYFSFHDEPETPTWQWIAAGAVVAALILAAVAL